MQWHDKELISLIINLHTNPHQRESAPISGSNFGQDRFEFLAAP